MNDAVRQPGVELRGVGVCRADRWILRDVNWSIPHGACVAILGPNGSGKSTLARILSGYVWPTAGEVTIDGNRFGETDLNQLRHSIRLVQVAGPFDVDVELSARDAVLTGLYGTIGLFDSPSEVEIDRAMQLLSRVGLAGVADHRYATLSSGERVRTLIARALIRRPALLLLDEPTNGLDLLAREQVLATLQSLLSDPQHAPTTIMITHHVEELSPLTSQVLLLDDGKPAAVGRPQDVLRAEILSAVYKCPLRVEMDHGRYYLRVDPEAWNELLDA